MPSAALASARGISGEQAFEDETAIPEPILSHLDWQDNTTVYFCNSRDEVIETAGLMCLNNIGKTLQAS